MACDANKTQRGIQETARTIDKLKQNLDIHRSRPCSSFVIRHASVKNLKGTEHTQRIQSVLDKERDLRHGHTVET